MNVRRFWHSSGWVVKRDLRRRRFAKDEGWVRLWKINMAESVRELLLLRRSTMHIYIDRWIYILRGWNLESSLTKKNQNFAFWTYTSFQCIICIRQVFVYLSIQPNPPILLSRKFRCAPPQPPPPVARADCPSRSIRPRDSLSLTLRENN